MAVIAWTASYEPSPQAWMALRTAAAAVARLGDQFQRHLSQPELEQTVIDEQRLSLREAM